MIAFLECLTHNYSLRELGIALEAARFDIVTVSFREENGRT